MPIDALGEWTADAFDLGDVVDRRRLHAAQATEVLDQRLAALGADAGNLVQHRGRARLAPASAMADDGEAVRLVADRLDEVQSRVRRRELQAARIRLDDQLFQAGLALRALGDAHHADLMQAEIGEHRPRDTDLTLAAIDQHEIGHLARLGRHALIATLEHLAHGAVIVTGRDAADIEAPVLRFLHLLAVIDDARGDGGFAHGMADVEALDAPGAFRKRKHLAQRAQARLLRRAIAHVLRNGEQRVLARHVEPDLALAMRRRHGGDVLELDRIAGNHQPRQRLLEIVLLEKRRHDFGRLRALRIRREEAAVADVAPGADHHQVDAGDAALDHARHHIGLDTAVRLDVLARLNARQRADLVAIDRRLLVMPFVRRTLHLFGQPLDHVVFPALQEEHRIRDILGIHLRRDLAGARRRAPVNLVEQAGARAVLEHRIFAGPQAEDALQELN